jgi:hypothetical protein
MLLELLTVMTTGAALAAGTGSVEAAAVTLTTSAVVGVEEASVPAALPPPPPPPQALRRSAPINTSGRIFTFYVPSLRHALFGRKFFHERHRGVV